MQQVQLEFKVLRVTLAIQVQQVQLVQRQPLQVQLAQLVQQDLQVLLVQLDHKVILVEQVLITHLALQQLKKTQELEDFALIKQIFKLQHLCLLMTKLMAQLIFNLSFAQLTIQQILLKDTCESVINLILLTLLFLQLQDQLLRKVDTLQFQFLM